MDILLLSISQSSVALCEVNASLRALFYKILRFVQGTRGFGHVQLMNNTLLEML